jgi:preprotein translocase subunit SecD
VPAKVIHDGYVAPPVCPSTYLPTKTTTPPAYPPLTGYPSNTSVQDTDHPTGDMVLPVAGTPERVELGPVLASGTIISNSYASDTSSGWEVIFDLSGPGQGIFNSKIAAPNVDDEVAIDLDGLVESNPVIEQSNFGSSGEINGPGIVGSSAGSLALLLKYGALPVAIYPLTSEVVSPTLGASSLHAGLLAGLLGLLLVMGYTIFYYRALGIVVVLGLVSSGAVLYAIIATLGHREGLTLDLSGITGLIVSVGITVDSYVVYFERLKDEVRAGRSIRSSVDKGFKSAYRTILSADAVSFIGALVLYLLSIGAVKGFALMLGLSTLLDVITAYVFTRPIVILLGRNRLFTEARGFGVARGLGAAAAEAGT